MWSALKIAIVHDWLVRPGGAERVLERLLGIFPKADLYTLFYIPGAVPKAIESRIKGVSFIQRLPGLRQHYGRYLPLFPKAVESWPLSGYNVVISSSYCVAKGALAGPDASHLCYCHTPMRYVWHQQKEYEPGLGTAGKLIFRAVASRLRQWDVRTSSRPNVFIANSRAVAERIARYYLRTAEVIHPPVDTIFFTPEERCRAGDYYLSVGALVPYKNFEKAAQACARLGRELVIAGDGPERPRLQGRAGVRVLGWQSREALLTLYRGCRALIAPGEEDFGIALVEAQACGKPVVALARGGARETVEHGHTGILYQEDSAEALIEAMRSLERTKFDSQRIRLQAEKFSAEVFDSKISSIIDRMKGGGQNAA